MNIFGDNTAPLADSITRASPILASPDAATIFHTENGVVSYHHRANVVVTAAFAAQASYMWPKGIPGTNDSWLGYALTASSISFGKPYLLRRSARDQGFKGDKCRPHRHVA
jgi:hypothetical protein